MIDRIATHMLAFAIVVHDRIRFLAIWAVSVAFISNPSLTFAQERAGEWAEMKSIRPKWYDCKMASHPLAIDGKLTDAAWLEAAWTDEFVDIEGDKKPKPRQRTRAKMLWDDQFLYIAAELMEEHLQASLKQHDSVIFQDNDFEVFVDPDGDNHEYLEFEMNAFNTTWDLRLPRPYKDGGKADDSFEFEGLKSAVHIQGTLNDPSDRDTQWSLEIAIPWSAFRKHTHVACPPAEGDQWRLNFSRVEWMFQTDNNTYTKQPKQREDNWVWSPQGIIDMHRPERWGFVEFSSQNGKRSEPVPGLRSLDARDGLMEIYHRQRTYHAKHQQWASSISELGLSQQDLPLLKDLSLEKTPTGFRAFVPIDPKVQDQKSKFLNVRQDSKLWSSQRIFNAPHPSKNALKRALDLAGANREQLELAIEQAPDEHLEAVEFLIENMPERDLTSLSARFLLENTRLAFDAWNNAPWKERIPREVFLNNILPYANINERRDEWRFDFRTRFLPLIDGATSPSHAAALLNQKLFPLVNVRYSTQRAKADQSPIESIKSGLASCTGLSILLIDACRACGIPARFVGTPLWSDKSGNHSWIEVWDNGGWHFTGAAEPDGIELDKAWFIGRASTAVRDDPLNAIYAVSFQQTPLSFPLVWDRSIDYIKAVNVTDRYTQLGSKTPPGTTTSMFRVIDASTRQRVGAAIEIVDANGVSLIQGTTKDERFDSNDHFLANLPSGKSFTAKVKFDNRSAEVTIVSEPRNGPIEIVLPLKAPANPMPAEPPSENQASATQAMNALRKYLTVAPSERPSPDSVPEFQLPMAKDQSQEAMSLLWSDHVAKIKNSRAQEMDAKVIQIGDLKMPIWWTVFGDKPVTGRSLFISMHGGGGAPPRVNQQQWENQKKLYQLSEGIYVAPRAPTDTWDLWHQSHIDAFFDRLIENFVCIHDVDPNRVYLMGYSAGGDGVYQVAPRMADRFAAAAMMAGHPNETSPLGLRNLPFAIHMGEKDAAYNRNKVAVEWSEKLSELRKQDTNGYEHVVKLHEGKQHWMDRQDAEAIPWMTKYVRRPFPDRIVWKQDDVRHSRFYWLASDASDKHDRALVRAHRIGQTIHIDYSDLPQLRVLLSDSFINLDEPIVVSYQSKQLFQARVNRTIGSLLNSLDHRPDFPSLTTAEIVLDLPTVPSSREP
jgi:hypothetical protein